MALVAKTTCNNILTNGIKCHREVRYSLYRVDLELSRGEHRQWMHVCGTCDRQIGRQNLMMQGWSIKEAINCERNPDMPTPTNAMPVERLTINLSPRQIRTINQLKTRHVTATL